MYQMQVAELHRGKARRRIGMMKWEWVVESGISGITSVRPQGWSLICD